MDCCDIYSEEFGRDEAIADAQRYRQRGLDRLSRAVRDEAVPGGIDGAAVLEVGGGAGMLSIELLRLGAASAVNVELSTSYRDAAEALAFEAGVQDRYHLVAADGAAFAAGSDGFDVVVLNRVVCCYEDAAVLLDAAAGAARRTLVASHPTIHPVARWVVAIGNRLRARRGSAFRTFVHPDSVLQRPALHGMEPVSLRRRPAWTVRSWSRVAATGPVREI